MDAALQQDWQAKKAPLKTTAFNNGVIISHAEEVSQDLILAFISAVDVIGNVWNVRAKLAEAKPIWYLGPRLMDFPNVGTWKEPDITGVWTTEKWGYVRVDRNTQCVAHIAMHEFAAMIHNFLSLEGQAQWKVVLNSSQAKIKNSANAFMAYLISFTGIAQAPELKPQELKRTYPAIHNFFSEMFPTTDFIDRVCALQCSKICVVG